MTSEKDKFEFLAPDFYFDIASDGFQRAQRAIAPSRRLVAANSPPFLALYIYVDAEGNQGGRLPVDPVLYVSDTCARSYRTRMVRNIHRLLDVDQLALLQYLDCNHISQTIFSPEYTYLMVDFTARALRDLPNSPEPDAWAPGYSKHDVCAGLARYRVENENEVLPAYAALRTQSIETARCGVFHRDLWRCSKPWAETWRSSSTACATLKICCSTLRCTSVLPSRSFLFVEPQPL